MRPRVVVAQPAAAVPDGRARATAAAPTSGPSSPRPDRKDPGPARELDPGALAQLRLRGPEEVVAVAEGDGTSDHREVEVEQGHDRRDGSADQPTGAGALLRGGLRGGRAGARGDGGAARLGLEAALRAARAPTSVGFDDDVADVARVAVVAVEEPAVEDDAAAHARWTRPWRGSSARPARRRASPRRARAPWRRCRSCTGSPSASASRARSGKPRQPGMLSGDTVSPPSGHRARRSPRRRRPRHRCGPRRPPRGARDEHPSASSAVGRGADRSGRAARRRSVTMPAAIFVPPTSTASRLSTGGNLSTGRGV